MNLTMILLAVGGYLAYQWYTSSSAPALHLTAAQMVQAASNVFRSAGTPIAGLAAVRAHAAEAGYTWEQVVSAFRTVGGAAWSDLQRAVAAAGEHPPQ